jgi:DNA-binding transcriptional ArsR family regulator|tara:strand:+ start:59 stop:772 length:714 start_codon:yes stop_codon:yes gene_type:complete
MDHKGYYAIIPANVRYDQRLPANAKLLYGEITALSNEKGYCWAGNDYFSVLYGVSKTSVSKWVSALRDSGYINVQVQYKEGTKQILHRYITLVNDPIEEKLMTPIRKVKDPIEEKLIDNNTSNNTNNNTMNIGVVTPEKKVKKVFVKPTLTEVIDFCNETQANIDPQDFMDFYESKGWMVGKNKMKCWMSCVRRWKRMEVEKNREKHEKNKAKQAKQNEQLRNRTIEHQLTDTSWAD